MSDSYTLLGVYMQKLQVRLTLLYDHHLRSHKNIFYFHLGMRPILASINQNNLSSLISLDFNS